MSNNERTTRIALSLALIAAILWVGIKLDQIADNTYSLKAHAYSELK